MRFETSAELRLFASSVRGALEGWQPPREPAFGTWWDEHDEELATEPSPGAAPEPPSAPEPPQPRRAGGLVDSVRGLMGRRGRDRR